MIFLHNFKNKLSFVSFTFLITLSSTNLLAQTCVNTPDGISAEKTDLGAGKCNLSVDLSILVPNAPKPKRIQFTIEYDSDDNGTLDSQAEFLYDPPGGAIPQGEIRLSDVAINNEFLISNVDCHTIFTTTIIGFTSTSGSGGNCTTETGYVDQNGFSTVLPINLISFKAKEVGSENLIYWATEGEENNYAQIIERSSNPTQGFNEIGRILSAGNTNELRNYDFIDEQPLDISYYRLTSIDFDGSTTYSSIVVVERAKESLEINKVYPVPVKSFAAVQYTSLKTGPLTLSIHNNLGKLKKNIHLQAVSGSNVTQIEIGELEPGMYILTITDGKRKVQQKIIKI